MNEQPWSRFANAYANAGGSQGGFTELAWEELRPTEVLGSHYRLFQ